VLDHIHQLLSDFLHKKRPAISRRSDRMLCKSGGSYHITAMRIFEMVGAVFINEIASFSKCPSI
jgi:hypothetical protein